MKTEKRIREIETEIERIVRQHSYVTSVPPTYRVYYLLCAYEFLTAHSDSFSRDQIKKSLTFAYNILPSIDSIETIQKDKNFNVSHLIEAKSFLDICFDYSGVVSAYITHSRGYANAELLDNNTIRFIPKYEGLRYDVLERKLSDNITQSGVDSFVSNPKLKQNIVDMNNSIIQSAKISPDSSISYSLQNIDIDIDDFMETFGRMIKGHLHLPDSWRFRDISQKEVIAFNVCLTGLSWAHKMAFTSQYRIYGDAIVKDILLLRGESNLAGQISRISTVAKEKVHRLLELLTYRSSDNKPDVAVTPLLRISSGHYLIAPSLILTSNLTRNLLSHLARNFNDEFDGVSSSFAIDMVKRFVSILHGKYRSRTNINIDKTDIDVALIDEMKRQVMICEFKWTIPPAETFEVLEKLDKENKAKKQLRKIKEYLEQDKSRGEAH